MKCPKCGTKVKGNFCPNCGEAAQVNKKRKKKPIYKRFWFIVLVIIVIISAYNKISENAKAAKPEKISWSDMILGEMLPEPEFKKGIVHINDSEELNIEYERVSENEFNSYLNACIEKGYTIEAENNSLYYIAYNEDGYKLELYYNDEEMKITLDKPVELSSIIWPQSQLGKVVPEPDSHYGKIDYENDMSFDILMGNMSREDYNEYVANCIESGFNVDYSKGDTYFYAYNADGYYISAKYEGFNTVYIMAKAPAEDKQAENEADDADDSDEQESESELDANGLRPGFKKAMDSYEAFMNEYVEFMKNYENNPSDLQLLANYAKYMTKYAQFCDDFEKWEDEDMNAAETAYYIAVQTRVNQKLLSAAG